MSRQWRLTLRAIEEADQDFWGELKAKRLSQKACARTLWVCSNTVGQWESGKESLPEGTWARVKVFPD